jgi:hypothetical protein
MKLDDERENGLFQHYRRNQAPRNGSEIEPLSTDTVHHDTRRYSEFRRSIKNQRGNQKGAHVMPKGGPREGAGRPRGSRGKRTRASIAQAETLGPTPLEVLLESMLAAHEGERAEAVDCAKAAAPYVHPKVAPTSPPAPVHEPLDYNVLSDTELDQLEKLYSKLLKQSPAGEAPAAQSRVRRGRYPRPVSSGAQ